MKAKLLRRIRKNWFIGITDTKTYVSIQKKGFGADEWYELHNFLVHILRLTGCGDIESWRMVEKHTAKRKKRVYHKEQPVKRQNLLNIISR